ncbi:MAG: helix-turn-helix domain-containing protein [Nanoarchaeota archaeon]
MQEKLKLFGLNLYERKAYDTILREGASTAHFIAKKSSVPSGKIYPVLDSLIEKGFVSLTAGRPKMFVGVSPEIAFANVVKKRAEELSLNTGKC